jgi:hypothetical protein
VIDVRGLVGRGVGVVVALSVGVGGYAVGRATRHSARVSGPAAISLPTMTLRLGALGGQPSIPPPKAVGGGR